MKQEQGGLRLWKRLLLMGFALADLRAGGWLLVWTITTAIPMPISIWAALLTVVGLLLISGGWLGWLAILTEPQWPLWQRRLMSVLGSADTVLGIALMLTGGGVALVSTNLQVGVQGLLLEVWGGLLLISGALFSLILEQSSGSVAVVWLWVDAVGKRVGGWARYALPWAAALVVLTYGRRLVWLFFRPDQLHWSLWAYAGAAPLFAAAILVLVPYPTRVLRAVAICLTLLAGASFAIILGEVIWAAIAWGLALPLFQAFIPLLVVSWFALMLSGISSFSAWLLYAIRSTAGEAHHSPNC